MSDPVSELCAAVVAAASALRGGAPVEPPILERPPKPEFGDYSTNAAMLLAPMLGEPPRQVADRLAAELGARLGDSLRSAEVAGPGFLNLFMSDAWCSRSLARTLEAGEAYGGGERSAGQRMNVEFVSANPTGPITVAAGRHAAYGDSLCRILEFTGNEVDREYYVNDRGTQIERFGASIRARANGEAPPEDGYQGAYLVEVAERIPGGGAMAADELATLGVEIMLEEIRASLERFRVRMDRFASERALHESGSVAAVLDRLEQRGHVYPLDAAVWLRTTDFGDDKDRVLVRSGGQLTYFAADIAYHEDKRTRGYERVIAIWGADHHGYVARMRAAWEALGGEPEGLELLIMQLVNLLEGGQRAQMSKRGGEFVSLDDLIEDIGVDATRWFLLQRSHDTALDLDLDLARRQSQDNPVYYAQYAHARIASILRRAGEQRVGEALAADVGGSPEELHRSSRTLVKRLLEFPQEISDTADRRAPHRLTTYVTELAQDFSAFYRDCKVVGAAEEGGDERLRIAMCEATRRVIARSLDLLGVAAPAEM
ncbi:MAG: arginine--tRNA ligase [Thermoleophilaceae bacterium]|nr:arginine--tRNA ligase [Thermoleophilaceae bacterium]